MMMLPYEAELFANVPNYSGIQPNIQTSKMIEG